jgi:hypothetical protein
MGKPANNYPSPDVFVNEALKLIEDAEKVGISLRVMGAIAVYLHSKDFKELWHRLDRLSGKKFTDIDFMCCGSTRSRVLSFFESKGYSYNKSQATIYGSKRLIFIGNTIPMVDVFFNKLEMCHTINFEKRLTVDYPTIPLAELLLEKLQIVKINEKDIKDAILLIRAHDLGESDNDLINAKYIAKLLSQDWGFYYTATTNLKKIKNFLPKYHVLTDADRQDIFAKTNKLIDIIEKEPKSTSWKIRAKIGPFKKWYREVEEAVR